MGDHGGFENDTHLDRLSAQQCAEDHWADHAAQSLKPGVPNGAQSLERTTRFRVCGR